MASTIPLLIQLNVACSLSRTRDKSFLCFRPRKHCVPTNCFNLDMMHNCTIFQSYSFPPDTKPSREANSTRKSYYYGSHIVKTNIRLWNSLCCTKKVICKFFISNCTGCVREVVAMLVSKTETNFSEFNLPKAKPTRVRPKYSRSPSFHLSDGMTSAPSAHGP